MATNKNTNINTDKYIYQDSTTVTGPQTNTTTTKEHTDTTTLGKHTDTVDNTVETNAATNAKADNAYNALKNQTANYGRATDLGYSSDQLDQNKLLSLYNNAARVQKDTSLAENQQAINQYGNSLKSAQDSYIDAMRKANANAIVSGAARGTQAANELSAILGMQQQGAEGATELAQQRAQIGLDYANALAEARTNAESEAYNRRKQAVDQLLQQYASDSDILAYLGYGAAGEYLGANTNNTEHTDGKTVYGEQVNKTKYGKQETTEKTGKQKTTVDYK